MVILESVANWNNYVSLCVHLQLGSKIIGRGVEAIHCGAAVATGVVVEGVVKITKIETLYKRPYVAFDFLNDLTVFLGSI